MRIWLSTALLTILILVLIIIPVSAEVGEYWRIGTNNTGFNLYESRALSFDGKLWIIGGTNSSTSQFRLDSVWNSTDGVTWSLATGHGGFINRSEHCVAVFDGKMWLTGGSGNSGVHAFGVWNSSDGITWNQANASNIGNIEPNGLACYLINHSGALYYFTANATYRNSVYKSTDGMIWTNISSAPLSLSTYSHQRDAIFEFNNKIYVVQAGYTSAGPAATQQLAIIWSSSDGITWDYVGMHPFFDWESSFAPYKDRVIIYGGRAGGTGVWNSLIYVTYDFKTYTLVNTTTQLCTEYVKLGVIPSSHFCVYSIGAGNMVEHGGKLWAIGTTLSAASYPFGLSSNTTQWTDDTNFPEVETPAPCITVGSNIIESAVETVETSAGAAIVFIIIGMTIIVAAVLIRLFSGGE